jgi:acetyl esterase/lipase
MVATQTNKKFFKKHKKLTIALASIVGLILAILLAFRISPVPGTFVIRLVFEKQAQEKRIAMEAHLPQHPVTVVGDRQYRSGDKNATLDVYMPSQITSDEQTLPVVIWTHGGAWISGDKRDSEPYFKLLADKGFVVIGLNYTLAPEKTYPYQLHELNDAHQYILDHAAEFHVDTSRIVLAGDSAGAQLSAQLATLITSPGYAKEVGVQPAITSDQLAAAVLYCGIYDMQKLATPNETIPKLVGWGLDVTVWAYSGTRDLDSPLLQQMSPIHYATSDFPKTFISGGNGDALTKQQSMPFAAVLQSKGVAVSPLFYPDNHVPSLPHESQFILDDDGMKNLVTMSQFLKETAATRD